MSAPPPKRPILIGTYAIDASIRETHTFESDVTMFPVEQGSPISDNVRPKPIAVEIEYVVSDTPLPPMDATRDADGTADRPSVNALAILQAIRDARQPISIATAVRSYDNMILQNLVVPRDATTGEALGFTASFVQITIVRNERTTVRTAQPQHAPKRTINAAGGTVGPYQPITYVVTLPAGENDAENRQHFAALYGQVFLEDVVGLHYAVSNPKSNPPDGYVANGVYYPIDPPQGGAPDANATAATYDPSTGTWQGPNGLPVATQPPANVQNVQYPGPLAN